MGVVGLVRMGRGKWGCARETWRRVDKGSKGIIGKGNMGMGEGNMGVGERNM